MERFVYRLDATDGSGHFRQGSIVSESADEARAALERREHAAAGYSLREDDGKVRQAFLDLIEQTMPGTTAKTVESMLDDGLDFKGFEQLPPPVRAALATHAQATPYELAYIGTERPARAADRKPPELRGKK